MDWSLLSCSRGGHITFAPDEPGLRAQVRAELSGRRGLAVPEVRRIRARPAGRSGPAAAAPLVPRGKEIRSKLILRVFAIERFVRAAVFIVRRGRAVAVPVVPDVGRAGL